MAVATIWRGAYDYILWSLAILVAQKRADTVEKMHRLVVMAGLLTGSKSALQNTATGCGVSVCLELESNNKKDNKHWLYSLNMT